MVYSRYLIWDNPLIACKIFLIQEDNCPTFLSQINQILNYFNNQMKIMNMQQSHI